MSAAARTAATAAIRPPSRLGVYLLEARYETLKNLRLPMYAIPTVAFPLVFYALFGFALRGKGSFDMATYLLATYGAFGVIGASFFGFGVGVAVERGQGWMLLKRATPMPAGAMLFARTVMALGFSLAIVLGLFALGAAFGGVRLPAAGWWSLGAVLVAGAVPFCALGLALGYLAGPNSAVAVVNLIYLPTAFLSGLWVPVQALPGWMQAIAPWLPPYHLGELALRQVGMPGREPVAQAVAYLAALTAVSLAVAAWAYRRDEGKTYG
ncbi:MAG TPA: ABC transporter permease [Thermoanaerobaculia bacterium]